MPFTQVSFIPNFCLCLIFDFRVQYRKKLFSIVYYFVLHFVVHIFIKTTWILLVTLTGDYYLYSYFADATTEVKTLSPTYVVVDAGSGYDFRCVADGNPPPKCEWFYKKEDATNWEIKSYNCVYSITSASEEHEGQYMCLAGNKGLLPSPEITLEIRSKLRLFKPTFTYLPNSWTLCVH